jgi:hypothetical protein
MSHDDMQHYRDSLRHIVRPDEPHERVESRHLTIEDYEALFLYDGCVEYASYGADTGEKESIALGYAEYINDVVRNEGRGRVSLFVHTDTALDVLCGIIDALTVEPYESDMRDALLERIIDLQLVDSV